ncbi:MAG: 2-hydroxychromene-2-carboxylate isomerase [Pseudomonadota bacterium]
MTTIDYFYSVLSPWSYFAGTRLEEIAAARGARVGYKPLDVVRLFAETGSLPLPQRPKARQAYRLQELRRASAKTGLPYHVEPAHWPTDPLPSSTAIIALAAAGGDVAALNTRIFAAVWAEQKDIADPGLIAEMLATLGVDPEGLDMAGAAETYQANTEEAISRGAFGVPFYIVGDECFWGQDRLADLDWHLARL